MKSYILLLVACGLLPSQLLSASLADSPAFSLAPKELLQLVDQQAGSTTSPAVVLLDDEHWSFRPDNTIERRQHYVLKILNQSAIDAWSAVQERWEPWHQERPSVRARVITSDAIAHELDPKTLVDAPAGSNLPHSYSDLRIVQGPLPAVAVGAVVESELIEHFTPVLGSMAFRGYLAWGVPVRFSRLTADYPESLPFRYSADLCPDRKETKSVRDGFVHLTVSFGAFEPSKDIDPLLPFDVPRVPSVTMSSGVSWNDLAVRYGKVVDNQIADAPVKDFVSRALRGGSERPAIIRQLVTALHSEVRYTGVEFADAAVVPAKPEQTLSRKYGDCKDKAALLVAMLRAAGIPAYVAILNAGLEQDVAAQHPGMGMFNHAIVYVPGPRELWIDATAEHSPIGSLPPGDEGRLALIIRPDTKELTKTPESASSDNVMMTELDYSLPDFGPSHVVESLSGAGEFDGAFRDMVALLDNEEVRKSAEERTQTEWDSKAKITISHPSINDYSKPLQIQTDVPDSRLLTVSETGAGVTFPLATLFSGLPRFFLTDDSKDTDTKDKKTRTQGFVLPVAFVARISCRIHIPAGFTVKKIPDDQTVKLGPATYAAHFVWKGQALTAEMSLDSGKRNYTLDEGNALKKAVEEFLKQPAPVLNVEPLGQTLLEEGRLREGLDAFRYLAAQHGAQAMNHVRLSRAYLQTGCGQEAREEARIATESAPNLSVTWRNLAFVNEHDLAGRKYKQGWEPTVVARALRKAISLQPEDLAIQVELADSFSYDAAGNQYVSTERLAEAVDVFQKIGESKVEQQGATDKLIFALAVLGRLDEVKSMLDRFGSNGSRLGYRVYLAAVRESASKAAADLRAAASGEELKQAFLSASNLLARSGQYEQEADLAAGLGLESQLFMPAANLRMVHHIDPKTLYPDSPENLIRSFIAAELETGEGPDSLARFWSSSAPADRLRIYLRNSQQAARAGSFQRGLLPSVVRDVYLSSVGIGTETNGPEGFRVRLTIGGRTLSTLVIRERGELKMLGSAELPDGVARQVLSDIEAGNQDTARKWLDWMREEIKIHSEDDPLGGPVFPRLWNRGAAAGPAQMRYAAASLLSSKEALPILQQAIDSEPDATRKAYYQVAYARACSYLKNWARGIPAAKSLAQAYPASDTALQLLSEAYAGAGQVEEAENVLKQAMHSSPDDVALRRLLVNSLVLADRMQEASQAAGETAASPGATTGDWNQYGWISLFAGNTDEEKIHQLERAQSQPSTAVENTIAAMYAEVGELNQARQISLESLEKFGYDTPDSAWRYVFGRISEQLGAKSTAAVCYQAIESDPDGDTPLSVRTLARKHLSAMNSATSHGR